MTFYQIRQGFTVILGENIYTGGQSVDLNDDEFRKHKHKLEGTVDDFPRLPNISNSEYSDEIAQLGAASVQEALEILDNRIDSSEAFQQSLKIKLSANLAVYVNPTGQDISGQTGQGSEAYQSLNFAYQDVVNLYDPDKYKVTIYLEDGVHVMTDQLDVPSVDGQNLSDRTIEVRNLNQIDDAVLQLNFPTAKDAFYFRAVQHRCYFGNLTIEAIANVNSVFEAGELCNVRIEDIKFRGSINRGFVRFYNGTQGNFIGDLILDGVSCQYVIYIGKNSGSTLPNGFKVSVPTGKTASFSTAFLKVYGAGAGLAIGTTAVFEVLGTAIGKKFEITSQTHLEFGSNDATPDLNVFPGNQPGVVIPAGYGNASFQSLTTRILSANLSLSIADNKYQHFTCDVSGLAVSLPAIAIKGSNFIIKNDSLSAQSFQVAGFNLKPGQILDLIYSGTKWISSSSLAFQTDFNFVRLTASSDVVISVNKDNNLKIDDLLIDYSVSGNNDQSRYWGFNLFRISNSYGWTWLGGADTTSNWFGEKKITINQQDFLFLNNTAYYLLQASRNGNAGQLSLSGRLAYQHIPN